MDEPINHDDATGPGMSSKLAVLRPGLTTRHSRNAIAPSPKYNKRDMLANTEMRGITSVLEGGVGFDLSA